MGQPLPPDLTPAPPAQQQQPVTVVNQLPQQQYFTAADLEAARKQEKDKLYERMEKQREQLEQFQADMDQWKADRQAEQDRLKAEQDAAQAAATKAEEDKLSVKELLDRREAEFKAQQEEMQKQWDTERAIAKKDRELFALQSFIQRRVAEEVAKDAIAPEFLDYIDGNNEQEVEASITKAKEKTASIVAGMGGQGSQQTFTPGVSPAGFSPSGPLDNIQGATKTYTQADIDAMSMQEYAKFRAQVGVDKAGNDHGLFN